MARLLSIIYRNSMDGPLKVTITAMNQLLYKRTSPRHISAVLRFIHLAIHQSCRLGTGSQVLWPQKRTVWTLCLPSTSSHLIWSTRNTETEPGLRTIWRLRGRNRFRVVEDCLQGDRRHPTIETCQSRHQTQDITRLRRLRTEWIT